MKPSHASWVTKFYNKMQNVIDIIWNGLKRSEISNAVSSEIEKDDHYNVRFYLRKL